MILDKEVEVGLSSKSIVHFEQLGYKIPKRIDKWGRYSTPRGTKIIVKVKDLPINSHALIKIKCDYCGEIFDREYSDHNYIKNKTSVEKDCCNNVVCMKKKREASIFSSYGVNHFSYIEGVKDKRKTTLVKKYGVSNISQNDLIKKQKENTMIKNYGKPYYLQTKQGKMKGAKNHNWKGGVSDITWFLRDKLKGWKTESIRACDYKCVVTGDRFDVVHHLKSFNTILYETFKNTGLEVKKRVKDYKCDELLLLEKECIKLHYHYGLGICLRKDVHDLFHSIYGLGNNTSEQFCEFKETYMKK